MKLGDVKYYSEEVVRVTSQLDGRMTREIVFILTLLSTSELNTLILLLHTLNSPNLHTTLVRWSLHQFGEKAGKIV